MTQEERVISYMREKGSITPFEATLNLGIIDLARTISYLRTKKGHTDIIGTPESAVNRYGDKVHYYRYSLAEEGVER